MTSHDDIGCRETVHQLDDYVDRELGADELEAIERHLKKCPPCAKEFNFENSVIRQIRRKVSEVDVPGDLKSRVLERLAQFDRDCH